MAVPRIALGLLAAAFIAVAGCSGRATTAEGHGHGHDDYPSHSHGHGEGHTHDFIEYRPRPIPDWWCARHGVPYQECGLCNSKLAVALQKKGDWCQDHNRPDSQCFVCHPELEAKFAARYEAKYGKAPPRPEATQ